MHGYEGGTLYLQALILVAGRTFLRYRLQVSLNVFSKDLFPSFIFSIFSLLATAIKVYTP
ncbi:hypothetical protein FHS56_000719 [Thermonema lapsum]|uniref:Uncharacterized protein n=1 Tax=Thermonema lapsum TaxID=28195 RepID=A0A846MNV1_9BACT|nr:hypothetical protein [Thermonema lapsum]